MNDSVGGNRKRILIIDDDPEVLDILRSYLEADYYIGTVSDGQFALDYIRENQTDLILMDVYMPGMNGFEVLDSIRKVHDGEGIPVIFITGKSNRNMVLESINVGVNGYLVKPIARDRLIRKVKEVLTQRENMHKKKTILAIDDDVTYLKIINNSLKDNFNVIMINSSKLALEYLAGHVPDVILLDYQMPMGEDNNFLEYINQSQELSHVPVIMLTGINDKKMMLESIKQRPTRFLLKPVSKLDLLKAIISALSEYGRTLND